METLHYKILDLINSNDSDLYAKISKDRSKNDLLFLLFSNFRIDNNVPKGLRLSKAGLTILKKFIKSWTYKFPEDFTFKSVHTLHLDYKMKMPYYCNEKQITVFDAKEAMFLKLANGNLDVWCKSNMPPERNKS